MPLVYSSNSPYYFDYLSQNYSKEDLRQDDNLCFYLNDELIKDNLEVAYKYKDALTGDYEDKKDFIEYYLCNGPELDTDTLLYYRNKIISNPELIEIATTTFNDTEYVTTLRYEKYGKEIFSLNGNCFTDPCSYLGPFSNALGISWDSKTFSTFNNVLASLFNGKDVTPQPPGRRTSHVLLPTEVLDDMMKYTLYRKKCVEKQIEKLSKNKIKHFLLNGDAYIIDKVKKICDLGRLKVHSNLGDCARLFNHARLYNPSNTSQNFQVPLSIPSSIVYPFGEPRYKQNNNSDYFASSNRTLLEPSTSVSYFETMASTNLNDRGFFSSDNKEYVCSWIAQGNFISEGKFYTKNQSHSSISAFTDVKSDEGINKTTIPKSSNSSGMNSGNTLDDYIVNHDELESNDSTKTSQYVASGCYMRYENVENYFNHFYGVEPKIVDKLISSGLIYATIRISSSSFDNNSVGSAKVITDIQLIGNTEINSTSTGVVVGISPIIIANHFSPPSVLYDVVSNEVINGNLTESSQDPDRIYNGYGMYGVRLPNGISNQCRVRFYIKDAQKAAQIGLSSNDSEIFNRGNLSTSITNPYDMSGDWNNLSELEKMLLEKPLTLSSISYRESIYPQRYWRETHRNTAWGIQKLTIDDDPNNICNHLVAVDFDLLWSIAMSGVQPTQDPVTGKINYRVYTRNKRSPQKAPSNCGIKYSHVGDTSRGINSGCAIHELYVDRFEAAIIDVYRHYGTEGMQAAPSIRKFDSCYRNTRVGGKSVSMHAFGLAFDFDASNNPNVKNSESKATLSKPIYRPFLRIMAAHGIHWLGVYGDIDWMHGQFASFSGECPGNGLTASANQAINALGKIH